MSKTEPINAGILCFDVVGYNKMNEDQLEVYHTLVSKKIFDCLNAVLADQEDFLYKKTWFGEITSAVKVNVNDASCGNGVCDPGEADDCPYCEFGEPCSDRPCILGTCPSDCS